jgi:hypothetical protein
VENSDAAALTGRKRGAVGCIRALIGHLFLMAYVRGLASGGKEAKSRIEMKDGGLAKKKPWRWRTARADKSCWWE